MYTGTDIVRISRIEKLIQNGIPSKIYTDDEARYIGTGQLRAQRAAGMFAAKEAVLKLLGTGIRLPLTQVCISHNTDGRPQVLVCGKVKEQALSLGIFRIDVSISHDGDYALATACAAVDAELSRYSRAILKFEAAPENAICPADIKKLLPKRKSDTHKGNYGRLFVIAGSEGLTGAAIMASNSALRCGAGLITLGCARELNPIFEAALTEVMTMPLPCRSSMISSDACPQITDTITKSDAVLIGPGLGRCDDITRLVADIVSKSQKPLIIDADALFALSHNMDILRSCSCPVVLTPHIGEFANLTGLSAEEILRNPAEHGKSFALQYAVTLVLKSHRTVVCTKDGEVFANILGNPGMAKGGSGDVLAGAIASFAAQGLKPEDAAKLGVYIHSLAGDMASLELGEYSATPYDTLSHIPYAIKYSSQGAETLAHLDRN